MLFRWLTTDFPRDMRRGWLLIKADLVFWCSVAGVLALLAAAPLAEHSEQSDSLGALATLTLATLLHRLLTPLVLVIAAARFAAVREGRDRGWAFVFATSRRRLVPVLLALMLAAALCLAGSMFAQAVTVAVLQAGQRDVIMIRAWAELIGGVVFVGLLVRFAFVPFLAALHTGREFQEEAAPRNALGALANRFAWPLVQSNRMTNDVWRELLPYLVLWWYAPAVAAGFPGLLRPFPSFAFHLLSFTALAVLFNHYAERARPAGTEDAASVSSPVCS